MKFSDFDKEKKKKEEVPPPAKALPPAALPLSPGAPKGPAAPPPLLSPVKPEQAELLESRRRSAREAYGSAIHVMKSVLRELEPEGIDTLLAPGVAGGAPGERSVPPPPGTGSGQNRLTATALRLIEELKSDNQALVALASHSTASNYLYAHSVNVAILSLYIALGLRWDEERLLTLGLAALLCDLGMIKYLGLSGQPRELTSEEWQEVQLHPVESQRLLEYIHDIEETTKHTISKIIASDHHRRLGRAEGQEGIHAAAQLIGLCDIYEAMSHVRSWREPMLPAAAIKRLIKDHASEFSRPLMQAFLERITLYPPGSFVELGSGEIACVLETHSDYPTRPKVEIRLNAQLKSQHPPLIIDLAQHPLVHIREPVDETKLGLKDKKLLLAFQAGRWWLE